MKSLFGFALLSSAAVITASAPAQANPTLTRTFVSSAGVDTNPCTVTAPCATLVAAYNALAPNGIIAALDPGKYGPLTISKPLTINGNGWAAITGTANGNGITVNAETGSVVLNGLEIDGAQAAYNGIVYNTGSSLVISNCVVKDFVVNPNNADGTNGNGILIQPQGGTLNFTITNTIAVNNQNDGIQYAPTVGNPTATGAIDHVVTNNNGNTGMAFSVTGSSAAAIDISNSVASNNIQNGLSEFSNPVLMGVKGPELVTVSNLLVLTVDDDQLSNNQIGINVQSGRMLLSRSVIAGNSIWGVSNFGVIDSFGDNRIYGNGNASAVQNATLSEITPQ